MIVSVLRSLQKQIVRYQMAFSEESTLGDILDNEAAKAILDKHVPGLSSNPQIAMGRPMTLKAVAGFAEAGINEEALQTIVKELGQLD